MSEIQDKDNPTLAAPVSVASSQARTITTTQIDGSVPAKGDQSKAALDKAIESVPAIGPTILFIIKRWGITGLALFLSGFILVLILVYFGVLPEQLVADKYKAAKAATQQPTENTVKPQGTFPLDVAREQHGWLQDIVDLYKRNSIDAQKGDPTKRYSVDVVGHLVEAPTTAFNWILTPQTDYEMVGTVFRVTTDAETNKEVFQQLDFKGDTHLLMISVPSCRKGDKLLAVIQLWSRLKPSPEDLRDVLQSEAK